jgi:hypothetical protein
MSTDLQMLDLVLVDSEVNHEELSAPQAVQHARTVRNRHNLRSEYQANLDQYDANHDIG